MTLETEPKDQAHWPLAGDTVEMLAWSAALVNGEKLAEIQGHLTTVASSYNPDDREITLSDALPAGFGTAWKSRSDASLLGDEFMFLRVWHRGSDRSGSAAVSFTPGTPVALGQTGISVTFSGAGRPGDFWVIAARPNTPNKVVPWELQVGRPPHGINRYRAPLALIQWADRGTGMLPQVISDCRERFMPLTRLETCSTFVVGDGVHSHGNFSRIQDAVDALPVAGGEIQVLPGRYRERVVIRGKRNVTICGCGVRTLVTAPDEERAAVFVLENSRSVTLQSLAIRSDSGVGVRVETRAVDAGQVSGAAGSVETGESEKMQALAPRADVRLRELAIRVRDQSAVFAQRVSGVTIEECDIVAVPLSADLDSTDRGRWPALFLAVDDVVVKGSAISALGGGARRTAQGGMQIAGGSDRVRIERNTIRGGNGNGITLGSVLYVPARAKDLPSTDYAAFLRAARRYPTGVAITLDEKGCVRLAPQPVPPDDDEGNPMVPASEGSLSEVEIVNNRVSATAGSGISVVQFFDPAERPDCVTVNGLVVRDNRIEGCLQGEIAEGSTSAMTYSGFGGVALAAVLGLDIRDNFIERNGLSHIDPVCGVFVLYAESARIEGNVIKENGPRVETKTQPRAGNRGGILIGLAAAPRRSTGRRASRIADPAARINHNLVSAPEGRALKLTAMGDVQVQSNHLTTEGFGVLRTHGAFNEVAVSGRLNNVPLMAGTGLSAALTDLAGGAAVWITDLGKTSELIERDTGEIKLATGQTVAGTGVGTTAGTTPARDNDAAAGSRNSGAVMFSGNRVRLALAESDAEPPSSAIVILSGDDVSVQDNQVEASVPPIRWFANSLIQGTSVRVIGNRFQELLGTARDQSLSAITIGRTMNVTTGNEGTHCFYIRGATNITTVRQGNVSLVEMLDEAACALFEKLDVKFQTQQAVTSEQATQPEEPQVILTLLR
ncbi:MAG: hypothetical protein HY682_11060 [Chloroflexi bacterium]|nr:hypothetical protein [Chloroflexota bacterium]